VFLQDLKTANNYHTFSSHTLLVIIVVFLKGSKNIGKCMKGSKNIASNRVVGKCIYESMSFIICLLPSKHNFVAVFQT
jgi:hypothetical protein